MPFVVMLVVSSSFRSVGCLWCGVFKFSSCLVPLLCWCSVFKFFVVFGAFFGVCVCVLVCLQVFVVLDAFWCWCGVFKFFVVFGAFWCVGVVSSSIRVGCLLVCCVVPSSFRRVGCLLVCWCGVFKFSSCLGLWCLGLNMLRVRGLRVSSFRPWASGLTS